MLSFLKVFVMTMVICCSAQDLFTLSPIEEEGGGEVTQGPSEYFENICPIDTVPVDCKEGDPIDICCCPSGETYTYASCPNADVGATCYCYTSGMDKFMKAMGVTKVTGTSSSKIIDVKAA